MGKRTQPYRLGFPERYFTQGDDSAGSDETHAKERLKKHMKRGSRLVINRHEGSKSPAQQTAIAISKKKRGDEEGQ